MSVILLVVSLLLFIGLIVIHELGHFLAARRGGVEVEEFGIFFPPKLFKRTTKAGWDFTINLLPLGGFVKLKGEHDTDTEPGSFGAATLLTKSKIMIAGVIMNLLTALVLLTILALVGIPSILPHQFTVKSDTTIAQSQIIISHVEKGSPAAAAGLRAEDRLIAIGASASSLQQVKSSQDLPAVTKALAGKKVYIEYSRSGGPVQRSRTTLLSTSTVAASVAAYNVAYNKAKACQIVNPPKGYLGITPVTYTTRRSTWSAPIVAAGVSVQTTALTFKALGSAVSGLGSTIAGAVTGNTNARQNGQCAASSEVSGPIGIYFVLKDGTALGFQYLLFIIALISLTLAIMNILPIPALDGGRLWITLVARALKRPLSSRTEEIVNGTGFVVLIILSILIALVDVHRFF